MKTIKTYSVILLAGAAAFASCDNSLQQDLSDAGVSVMADEQVKYENNVITVRKGTPITFSLEGNPDYITFFSGEIGHQYKYRNRQEINPEDVEECNFKFTVAVPTGGTSASCKDQLDILYLAEEIDTETEEVTVPAFPGLSKSDYEADSILVENTAWKTLVPRTDLPQNVNSSVTRSVSVKEFIGRKLTLAIVLNKDRKKDMVTNPDTGKPWTNVQSQFAFTNMRIETVWKNGRVTNSYAAAFGFTPLNMDWRKGFTDQKSGGTFVAGDGYGSVTTGTPGLWNLSGAGTGGMTIGATQRGEEWKYSWLVSDYLNLTECRETDQGVLVKEISQNIASYTYTYESVGTYTATFLMKNSNYNFTESKTKEFVINVTE